MLVWVACRIQRTTRWLIYVQPCPTANILTNIEHVQEQTARILQEQERDLLRAFRARLFDVQTELEKERAR